MFAGEAGIEESCRRIAEFEHQADTVTRDVLHAVRRSFINPFDRSSITALISTMNDTIDEMHQTPTEVTRNPDTPFTPKLYQLPAMRGPTRPLIHSHVTVALSPAPTGDASHPPQP